MYNTFVVRARRLFLYSFMKTPLFLPRLLTILGIVYASIFGGVVEQDALMRIVHQVALAFLLIAWLIVLWRERRPFPATPLDWPLLGLGLGWTIAAIFSRHPRLSLEYAWLIWMVILAYYLFVDLMRRSPRWQWWIFEGLFLTGALFVGFAVAEMVMWYFGIDILPQFVQGWPPLFGYTVPPIIHEVSLPLGYNNPTGAYCLLIIPLALAGAQTAPRRDLRWGLGALAFTLIAVVLATRSRGAAMGLAALLGLSLLAWLLRPPVRQRFPRPLQVLLAPRLLIGGAVVAAAVAAALVFFLMLRARDANSISRLDLWVSAVQIVADDPLTGTGPRLFSGERLWYPHWKFSHSYMPLIHAHSLWFQWLAEGGLVVLVPTLWLLDQLRRMWWRAWQTGDRIRRRRLEGAAIALAAYATHSLVDTFLQAQIITPVVIIGAYMVAGDRSRPALTAPQQRRRQKMVWAVLVLLIVLQIAFVPLHRGLWAHRQALARRADGDLKGALTAERAAQSADPWNDLYRLQEAVILGELAATDPPSYLAQAIAAFEDAVQRSATWDVGWHNLAALYAQAGRFEEAIAAEQKAIGWNQLNGGYFLKLAEYCTAAGRSDEAHAAYLEALETSPWLASSTFWTDPAHPERRAALVEAVSRSLAADPAVALDIAVYSEQYQAALYVARRQQAADKTEASLTARLAALWPVDAQTPPCWACYDPALYAPNAQAASYIAKAEWLLEHEEAADDELSAEKAARAAIFLSENQVGWGWYVLARLAERSGVEADTVNDYLARAWRSAHDFRFSYDTTVFTLHAGLDVLPQAQTLPISRQRYEPWLRLAGRHEAAGDWQAAREIYKQLLEQDPYAWDIRLRLDAALARARP
ncbi:MAG: O-antigen ligase family protein, partial [Aggregatilineaceae bacterium]